MRTLLARACAVMLLVAVACNGLMAAEFVVKSDGKARDGKFRVKTWVEMDANWKPVLCYQVIYEKMRHPRVFRQIELVWKCDEPIDKDTPTKRLPDVLPDAPNDLAPLRE